MLSRVSGKLLRKHARNPRRAQGHTHGLLRSRSWANPSPAFRPAYAKKPGTSDALHLDFFVRAKRYHATKKLLRSHAASTWISLHAHRDMFLRKDCCEFAPPNRLMHTIMPHFRHGSTLGSQSARKKTWISIHDQGNRFMRLKTAAFSRCGHTWISLRAQ